MHAAYNLGRIALHPMQRRIREDRVERPLTVDLVERMPVLFDPRDNLLRVGGESGGVRASLVEEVGRCVEPDDGAAGKDGGSKRFACEFA